MVEGALVIPLILLLTFLMIDFSNILSQHLVYWNALKVAAREVAVKPRAEAEADGQTRLAELLADEAFTEISASIRSDITDIGTECLELRVKAPLNCFFCRIFGGTSSTLQLNRGILMPLNM